MQSKIKLHLLCGEGGKTSWQGRTVHEGLLSNRMECLRETNLCEARAVHNGKFLHFLDLCVRKISILEQVDVVASMRSLANSLEVGCDCSSLGRNSPAGQIRQG